MTSKREDQALVRASNEERIREQHGITYRPKTRAEQWNDMPWLQQRVMELERWHVSESGPGHPRLDDDDPDMIRVCRGQHGPEDRCEWEEYQRQAIVEVFMAAAAQRAERADAAYDRADQRLIDERSEWFIKEADYQRTIRLQGEEIKRMVAALDEYFRLTKGGPHIDPSKVSSEVLHEDITRFAARFEKAEQVLQDAFAKAKAAGS